MILNLKSPFGQKSEMTRAQNPSPLSNHAVLPVDHPPMLTSPELPDSEIVLPTEPTPSTEQKYKASPKTRKTVNSGRVAGVTPAKATKATSVVAALSQPDGASLDQLMALTGWQAHSIRGFLSGTVRKKLGLVLIHVGGSDGVKRYRITGSSQTE